MCVGVTARQSISDIFETQCIGYLQMSLQEYTRLQAVPLDYRAY